MQIGVVFPQTELGGSAAVVRTYAEGVERLGFAHVLVYDHVLGADSSARPGWTGFYDHRDAFLEPLVLFAFLARECGLGFVTDVLVLPQRQTALVAKQAATLDLLAPGRLRLGVGIGWNDVEYDALGVEFMTRARRVEEQIPLLRRLWTEPTLDHVGETDTVAAAGIVPLPTRPIPIWIGSGTDARAVGRVGRLADGWLPMPQVRPQAGFEEAWAAVRAAAREAGRDPEAIGLEGNVHVRAEHVDRTRDRVARWRDAGAGAVAFNPLRDGARWPDGHLDVLLRAADALG